MLYLGGASSFVGSEHKSWFIETMAELGPAPYWDSWDTVVLLLKGFEKAFVDACKEFWLEVGEARGTRIIKMEDVTMTT